MTRHPFRFAALPVSLCFASALLADGTIRVQATIEPAPGLPPHLLRTIASPDLIPPPLTIQIKDSRLVQRAGRFTMILDQSNQNVTVLDHAGKIKATKTLTAWLDETKQAIPPEGAPKVETTFESKKTGRVKVIHGIAAEEHEATIGMRPAELGMSLKMIMRVWTATAEAVRQSPSLRELDAFEKPAGSLMELWQLLERGSRGGGSMDSLMKDLKTMGRAPLRFDAEFHVIMPPALAEEIRERGIAFPSAGTPWAKMRLELAEISAAPIEDAAFEAPEGFRTATSSEIIASIKKRPGASAHSSEAHSHHHE